MIKETCTVKQIYISPAQGAEMCRVSQVNALVGLGLEGDRYAQGLGFWQTVKKPRNTIRHVSLISQEDIDAVYQECGIDYGGFVSRRNLILSGFCDLPILIDKEFMVGEVVMRGVEECTPCKRPSEISGIGGFQQAFKTNGRGGLRAEILTAGIIFEGAVLRV